jgi:hypothetical protein
MPNWLIKSAIHRVISWLPRRQFWNGLLQTYVTKSTEITPRAFEEKVAECNRHFAAFRLLNPDQEEFTVMELGTGWVPIITVGLYLCGAREIWTIDIDPLLKKERLQAILELYSRYAANGQLRGVLPAFRPDRVERLTALMAQAADEPPAALLERLNIHVLVMDAQKTPVPAASVDFFESSGVLEYIPRVVLHGILGEFRRVALPGAVMSHRLNLVDQFSYFDRSITPFNFLKYTDSEWRWFNSPLIWQSRLRISDYRALFHETGWKLVQEESVSGSPGELAKVTLAPEFGHYRQADLLVLHSFLTARLAGGPSK